MAREVCGLRSYRLTKDDFMDYMKANLGIAKVIKNSTKIDYEKKVRFMKHTSEVILEHLFSNELNQESFESAKLATETTVQFLIETPQSYDLISALNQNSDYLYAHSLGVSVYSVMIGRKLDWHSISTTYKLSMGGLFHDIGKKEIDPVILNKSRTSLTLEEVKILESHPSRGMEILSALPSISSDLMEIVLQHHERAGGTGYPGHLSGPKTHPLARVVAVADEFCKMVIDGPDQSKVSPVEAIRRLDALYSKSLDGNALAALRNLISSR